MKYLVTGATGHLGKLVIHQLLNLVEPDQIAVSVRDPQKASDLAEKGIDVRQGDFDNQDSLLSAFKGIERLLIISTDGDNETRIRQHLNAVAGAKASGVKFIAYTSLGDATNSKLFLAEVHRKTEAAIIETGIPYVFLRNNWYLENESSSISGVASGAPWISATGEGKVGWAPRKDYAEAAAKVLVNESYKNQILELSGPSRTTEELAKIVSHVVKKPVEVSQVSFEKYHEIMASFGLPDHIADLVTQIQKDISTDTLHVENSDFEAVLGHPLTPLEDAIEEILSK